MTTEESKEKKSKTMMKTSTGVDRLSYLPELLLHYILSCLDIKDLPRTSLISTKWKNLWKSLPDLNFNQSYDTKRDKRMSSVNRAEGMSLVDRVLLYRDRKSPLRKLHLPSFHCWDFNRLETWLLYALKLCNKELHLEIPYNKKYILFPELYSSPSKIEVFKLKAVQRKGKYFIPVQLPASICSASRLRKLELESIRLPDRNMHDEVILNYPGLEHLVLKDCDHVNVEVLTIFASNLKTLVVENYDSAKVGSCKIKISTPNLKSIVLYGCVYKDYSLGDLSSVVIARIGDAFMLLQTHCLIEVLNGLPNVTKLELSGSGACGKPSGGSEPIIQMRLNPFLCLRYLKLTGLSNDSCIQSSKNILKNAPCIETLVLKFQAFGTENKVDAWEKDLSFHHLKDVNIIDFTHSTMEFTFLAFLLETAMILERMTVTYSKLNKKEVATSRRKLKSYPTGSSKVNIHFVEV